jgi:phthalate 4,5-cis-dihydrodiol dehydrogenase
MESRTALRIGMVGCGWQGRALAEAVVRCESVRLIACADPDEAAACGVAALSSEVSTHASVEALLAERDVDAIVIATPHHLLAPVALAALREGKHVMAEKPLALNEHEAAEIEEAVAHAGVCYMAGYSFRFSMGRYVRELLDAGVAGEILAITSSISVGPLNDGWIAYPETGGGPLLFIGSHLVDCILWFLDQEPIEVQAMVQKRDDTGADARSVFQITFANEALAQCLVAQGASTFFYEIDIHGSAGKISLRGRNFLQFEIEVSSRSVPTYGEPAAIRPAVRRDNIGMMLVPELEEFASAIRERRAPLITIADGRRVLRVLDAVMKSGRSNQPVRLSG